MAVTVASFKVRFPEFDTVVEERVQLFIDDAIAEIGLDNPCWVSLERYDRGVFYLAAHWLFLGKRTAAGDASGAAGSATSKSVGSVSLGFSSPDMSSLDIADAQFMTTQYGREYLRLQRFVGLGAKVIGDVTTV